MNWPYQIYNTVLSLNTCFCCEKGRQVFIARIVYYTGILFFFAWKLHGLCHKEWIVILARLLPWVKTGFIFHTEWCKRQWINQLWVYHECFGPSKLRILYCLVTTASIPIYFVFWNYAHICDRAALWMFIVRIAKPVFQTFWKYTWRCACRTITIPINSCCIKKRSSSAFTTNSLSIKLSHLYGRFCR